MQTPKRSVGKYSTYTHQQLSRLNQAVAYEIGQQRSLIASLQGLRYRQKPMSESWSKTTEQIQIEQALLSRLYLVRRAVMAELARRDTTDIPF